MIRYYYENAITISVQCDQVNCTRWFYLFFYGIIRQYDMCLFEFGKTPINTEHSLHAFNLIFLFCDLFYFTLTFRFSKVSRLSLLNKFKLKKELVGFFFLF